MNEIKIYLKGTPGFKPAVKAKLEDASKYKIRNINTDNILVLMSAGSQLADLKTTIGEDLATVYGLQFLASLDTHEALEITRGKLSESPFKMSLWKEEHSNIKRKRESQKPQRDPGVRAF